VNQGLAKGYGDGRFGPNDSITRAEFVTLLNRIFGYEKKAEKSFPGVKPGAWYAGEIAKAYHAGIISGDNKGNMNSEAVISRQEAVVILTRAFSLEGEYLDAALKYADLNQIADWALGSVGTMTKWGYVTGRPGNLFAPKANLSRAEAVKMIDNVMGEMINTAGTYTRVVPGNMVISSPGVTLKDTYIAGDLYITEGIGSDTIQLIDVEVKGRTIVADGVDMKHLLSGTKSEQGNAQGQPTPKPTTMPGIQPTSMPGSTTPTATPASPSTPNPTTQPTPTPTPIISGNTYYVDFENGDDANQGTSPQSPWKHCPGDSNAVGVAAAASLSPGDTVLFRGGVIYRGMIKTISDGINYRGDAWPDGVKAIIDGSDLFLNEKKPCTQEECGSNPNWSNILCVDLPDTIEKYSDFLMFDESSKLWLAQFPKVPDPFWEDDFSNYRPVSKENITVNSIKDPEFFNQTDPHYWDGAYIMIWINPNSVVAQPVTGYDPATGTIFYKELSENAIYGDRDQYYSMINHIDLITQPGEYCVDEANHKMYYWPRDNSELSLVTRSTGFNVIGNSDLVFEGFIIQRLVGGSAVYTRGAWMGSGLRSNNLTIRNNEMRWIRQNGSIHTGAITLRKGTGHIIENNYIHDIQRGSGIHVPGEVTNTIILNNIITRSGYKGIWLAGDENIQITGNRFFDNKATHGTDVSVFTSKNVLFANNIAYNSKTEMFSFEHDENIFIYNNILLGNGASAGIIRQNGDDMKGILFIAHNTVLYSGNNIGLNCGPSRYEDARYIVKNNILDGWQAGNMQYEVSSNIYTGLSWNQKERYGWYLMPGEMVEKNLQFIFQSPVEEVAPVVVPTDDLVEIYRLKDGSPAIGAGEILNDVIPSEALQLFPDFNFYQDFRGNPRTGDKKSDIGALQYSGK
jgi:parallel beta-helix repeat protein